MELPTYRCHKRVQAMRIAEIHLVMRPAPNTFPETLVETHLLVPGPTESVLESVEVDGAYMAKHKPRLGGYYVRYEDDYESFSPAKAFEDGYTRVEE